MVLNPGSSSDFPFGVSTSLAPELHEHESLTPLSFTGFDLTVHCHGSSGLAPGVVFGDVTSFDDLLLLWNLRAAGAQVVFYDPEWAERLRPFVDAFLAAIRRRPGEASNQVNFWSRAPDFFGLEGVRPDLDVSGLQPAPFRGGDISIWNGGNIRPVRPQFSAWHRDVVSSFSETEGRATASFALPDRPFDDDDPQAFDQQYVVTVAAKQYRASLDDRTFSTPFVPKLNEFYGRNFHFIYDEARAELGSFGGGAVGLITSVSKQQLSVNAIRVHEWLKAFFSHAGIAVERSEPGRRCSHLIRHANQSILSN
jgi:hypothetical protein